MAHFALIDDSNIVIYVMVVANDDILDENGNESEEIGRQFCKKFMLSSGSRGTGRWIQTSYSGSFRKNYAGTGATYDERLDAFIPRCQHASWVLDEETCQWSPPVPYPTDGAIYTWNESSTSWSRVY